MGVLLVLAGGAGACERENPGFKLKGTGDDPSDTTSLLTTSVSGPTVTGDTGMTVPTTMSEPETASTNITLTGDTGTTTTTTTTSDETTDATTGDDVMFPVDCNDPVFSAYEDALVDTFFNNEPEGGQGCQGGEGDALCRDRSSGDASASQIFYQADADPLQDFASIYAVRYAVPSPKYVDLPPELAAYEGAEVKTVSWVGAKVKFHVFRPSDPAGWQPMVLQVLRFHPGDVWEAGSGDLLTPCVDPAASFRCRRCDEGEKTCLDDWDKMVGLPYPTPIVPEATFELMAEPKAGADVEIELPIEALKQMEELSGWLLAEGMMVLPKSPVGANIVAVKTLDGDAKFHPQISVKYCNPVLQP